MDNKEYKKYIIEMLKDINNLKALNIIYELVSKYYTHE